MIAVFLRFIPPTLLRIGNDLPWNVVTTWLPLIYELPTTLHTTCLSICLMIAVFLRFISSILPRLGKGLACDMPTTWLPIVHEFPLTTSLWLAYNDNVATICLMIAILLRFVSPTLLRLCLRRGYDVVTTCIRISLRQLFAYNVATIIQLQLGNHMIYDVATVKRLCYECLDTFLTTWMRFAYKLLYGLPYDRDLSPFDFSDFVCDAPTTSLPLIYDDYDLRTTWLQFAYDLAMTCLRITLRITFRLCYDFL